MHYPREEDNQMIALLDLLVNKRVITKQEDRKVLLCLTKENQIIDCRRIKQSPHTLQGKQFPNDI